MQEFFYETPLVLMNPAYNLLVLRFSTSKETIRVLKKVEKPCDGRYASMSLPTKL